MKSPAPSPRIRSPAQCLNKQPNPCYSTCERSSFTALPGSVVLSCKVHISAARLPAGNPHSNRPRVPHTIRHTEGGAACRPQADWAHPHLLAAMSSGRVTDLANPAACCSALACGVWAPSHPPLAARTQPPAPAQRPPECCPASTAWGSWNCESDSDLEWQGQGSPGVAMPDAIVMRWSSSHCTAPTLQ